MDFRPEVHVILNTCQELQEMCENMKITFNAYKETNSENSRHNNIEHYLTSREVLTNPVIDCLQTLNELRICAKRMGLKSRDLNTGKKRKRKHNKCYYRSQHKRTKPLKHVLIKDSYYLKQFWAESISCVVLNKSTCQLMFSIKWEGYDARENTWQPMNDIRDCNLLFEDFHALQFKNGAKIEYNSEDLHQLVTCLTEIIGPHEKTDTCLVLKLNSMSMKEFFNESKKKLLNQMKQRIEPLVQSLDKIKRKKVFGNNFWEQKILIQYVVNELKIEENFGNLREFFRFCTQRKIVLKELKKWEKSINESIVERREADEATIQVQNHVDLEIPPPLELITRYKWHKKCTVEDVTNLQKISCDCEDNCGRNRSCVCALKIYKDSKRFKSSNVIYECNELCNCDLTCPNRRVQRGRPFKLIVFRTEDGRGWGVMTGEKIPYKAFIMEYTGEVITSAQTDKRDATYLFNINEEFCGKCLFIDGNKCGNTTRFANHSCEPNMDMHMAVVDQKEVIPRIAFFANRPIKAYEELTYHYGRKTLETDENGDYCNSDKDSGIGSDSDSNTSPQTQQSVQRIACLCGSKICKKFL